MKGKIFKKEAEELFSYFDERFGMPKEIFAGLGFFKTQKKIYIVTKSSLDNPLFKEAETAGIACLRQNGILKPTSDFLQLFGKYAKKNVIELTKEQAEKFIRGEDLEIKAAQIEKQIEQQTQKQPKPKEKQTEKIEDGYVIMEFKSHVLGCANFKQGVLKNMLPKFKRVNLKLYQ